MRVAITVLGFILLSGSIIFSGCANQTEEPDVDTMGYTVKVTPTKTSSPLGSGPGEALEYIQQVELGNSRRQVEDTLPSSVETEELEVTVNDATVRYKLQDSTSFTVDYAK